MESEKLAVAKKITNLQPITQNAAEKILTNALGKIPSALLAPNQLVAAELAKWLSDHGLALTQVAVVGTPEVVAKFKQQHGGK